MPCTGIGTRSIAASKGKYFSFETSGWPTGTAFAQSVCLRKAHHQLPAVRMAGLPAASRVETAIRRRSARVGTAGQPALVQAETGGRRHRGQVHMATRLALVSDERAHHQWWEAVQTAVRPIWRQAQTCLSVEFHAGLAAAPRRCRSHLRNRRRRHAAFRAWRFQPRRIAKRQSTAQSSQGIRYPFGRYTPAAGRSNGRRRLDKPRARSGAPGAVTKMSQ